MSSGNTGEKPKGQSSKAHVKNPLRYILFAASAFNFELSA
jgi:hypothetical protein